MNKFLALSLFAAMTVNPIFCNEAQKPAQTKSAECVCQDCTCENCECTAQTCKCPTPAQPTQVAAATPEKSKSAECTTCKSCCS